MSKKYVYKKNEGISQDVFYFCLIMLRKISFLSNSSNLFC